MALKYILQQFGFKTGLNPNDADQRNVLLRFVNEAALELYHISDMTGCLEEQYFKINSNQTIALPDYVGQIRAMREADSTIAIKLSQLRPRYNQFSWPDEWRNWRIKGLQPLQTSLQNQSKIKFTVKAVESPAVVVSISGPSVGSSCISENITMNALTKSTSNNYLDITSLTKDRVNTYDVLVTDVDDMQISYIPSNKLEARFQIVDISTFPWFPPLVSPLLGWVEVLYKKAMPWLSNDNDEFIAPGFDNVIVNKCLQLYYEEEGNVPLAQAYYAKANQSLAQIHEDANRGTDDCVALVENPQDKIFNRTGFGRDWQQAYRIIGR